MMPPTSELAVPAHPLRVLVVDDAVIFRRTISDSLASIPGVEVVGAAANGKIALEKIELLRPDLVTLDLEMPVLDGMEVLRRLHEQPDPPQVLILTGETAVEARATTDALRLGAFDFIAKPRGHDRQENQQDLRAKLARRVQALLRMRERRASAASRRSAGSKAAPVAEPRAAESSPPPKVSVFPPRDVEVIAIGISTGGPRALAELLPRLPGDFPLPILIVQHMPALFTQSLADELDRLASVTVGEASDGQPVRAGHVYLAPGGRQMKVVQEENAFVIRITEDPPENSCKPSVDYLFRSVADAYGNHAIGIVMTGMGYDGTVGSRMLKSRGAGIICQDEASCVVFGMPRGPIEQGLADAVVSLDALPDMLLSCVMEGRVP